MLLVQRHFCWHQYVILMCGGTVYRILLCGLGIGVYGGGGGIDCNNYVCSVALLLLQYLCVV